mgnify:CR=1 FL=1
MGTAHLDLEPRLPDVPGRSGSEAVSVRPKIKSALARREAKPERGLTKRELIDALASPEVQRAMQQAVDERVESILKRAIRPLQRTGGGVFGDIPVEDFEYEAEHADELAGKLIPCRVEGCGKLREANCIADIDERRASGRPSSDFCWCGWKAEQAPTW